VLQRLRRRIGRETKKLAKVARCAALRQIETEEQQEQDRDNLDEALAMFGLVAETHESAPLQPLYLWPCNVRSWLLFQKVQTQWHTDQGIPVGLDYSRVKSALSMLGVKRRDRCELFEDIQAMELATLNAWNERRENSG
jgi:hypothetical protein